MKQLTDLKAILHSKRANIYYLELCRVLQKDGRVLYLSEKGKEYQYWNIRLNSKNGIKLQVVVEEFNDGKKVFDYYSDRNYIPKPKQQPRRDGKGEGSTRSTDVDTTTTDTTPSVTSSAKSIAQKHIDVKDITTRDQLLGGIDTMMMH